MLHLNGTSCVAIRRFQLVLFVIKGGSLMRRILLAQSKAEAAVGAGCWVLGASDVTMGSRNPAMWQWQVTAAAEATVFPFPLSLPSRPTLKVSSLCNMLGKWVNICLVFERFPFVSCDFGALSCATASAAATAASSGVAFVRHSTTNGFTYTDSEPFAHVHLTCISLSLSLAISFCLSVWMGGSVAP